MLQSFNFQKKIQCNTLETKLKQKRKLLAQRKKVAVKAARDRFGDVWRMRKNVLIAKFNQITR